MNEKAKSDIVPAADQSDKYLKEIKDDVKKKTPKSRPIAVKEIKDEKTKPAKPKQEPDVAKSSPTL